MDTAFTPYDEYSEYSRLFLSCLPPTFLLDVPKIIRESTLLAFKRDTELLQGVRRDKYPIDRRALIETGLYNLATRYDGVHAVERKNAGNNYSHVELICRRLVLIPAAVESPGDMIRHAVYRHSLALNPQQAFAGMSDDTIVGDALLGVVLYGPSSEYPKRQEAATPGFVIVRFPANDWSCYVEGRVDLLRRLTEHEKSLEKDRETVESPVAVQPVAVTQEIS